MKNLVRKLGGGGYKTLIVKNPLSRLLEASKGIRKPFLSVAAVLVASLLFTACPPPDDTALGGDPPKPANSNTSVQLSDLKVTYSGDTTSLVTLANGEDGSQEGHYEVLDTDSARATIKVVATAASKDAEINIWWVNGSTGDGMSAPVKATGTLENIPVPSNANNTVIYITVTNSLNLDEDGEIPSYEYDIVITPPQVETRLGSLKLSFTAVADPNFGASENLITNFVDTNTSYSVIIPTISADKVGEPVYISATAFDTVSNPPPQVVISSSGTYNKLTGSVGVIPALGAAPTVVQIKVTNGISEEKPLGTSSVYKVSIVPPQNGSDIDSTLQHLSLVYDDGSQALTGFDSQGITFGMQIPNNTVKTVKIANSQPASSLSSMAVEVSRDGGSYSTYTLSNGEDGGSGEALAVPDKNKTLTFKIVVTAANNATHQYLVTFTNPARQKTWGGTVEFGASNPLGKENMFFDHVEIEIPGSDSALIVELTAAPGAPNGTPPDRWSVAIDERIRPTAFITVAKLQKGDGLVTYRDSFDVTESTPNTGNKLTVDKGRLARIIYNAQDLAALGDAGNATENWYMASDIDLTEMSGNWNGPTGYSGHFNGNGKTINGLRLTKTNSDTGLFATLGDGATLENFTVKVSTPTPLNITENVHFGGIIGLVDVNSTKFVTLKNIRVEGELEYSGLTGEKWFIVGGFLGEVRGASKVNIEKCVSAINVEAKLNNNHNSSNFDAVVGGFIGKLLSGTVNITDSYSTGNVLLNNSGNRNLAAGGLIGALGNSNSVYYPGTIEIKNSYSAGTVAVSVNGNKTVAAGGLVGSYQSGTVSLHNSVVLGESINASGSGTVNTGRVVGIPHNNLTLDNNYANSAMKINTAIVAAGADVAKDKKHGAEMALSAMDKTFWINLGFSETNWDFSGLNVATGSYPKLRLK